MLPLVILAGGRATRLGPAAAELPKFLMPVDAGRCFADLQLEWVRAQGFTRVRLAVGHLAAQVRAHVGDGARYGLEVAYVEDGPSPAGTGGAVRLATRGDPSPVAVLYGDTILDLDCPAVVAAAEGEHALMTLIEAPPGQAANATLEGDRARYDKLAPAPGFRLIDYGFLVLSPAFLAALPDTVPLDLAAPLAAASARGLVKGTLATRPFWEINTPEALEAFRRRFGRPAR